MPEITTATNQPMCGVILLKMPDGAPVQIAILDPNSNNVLRMPTEIEVGELLRGAIEQRERANLQSIVRAVINGPRIVPANGIPGLN